MAREIELKFDVDPGCDAALANAPLLAGNEPKTTEQEAIYFDTSKRLLRRNGFSLRVRRSGSRWIQTLKHKAGGSAGMFDRDEWEVPVAGPTLDLDALAGTPLVRIVKKKALERLRPVVRTAVERRLWLVALDGTQAEVTHDSGTMQAGKATAPVSEIEIELRSGDAAALFDLAEALGAAVPIRLGVLSKAERGYALADGKLAKASKAEPLRLGAEDRVAEAVEAVVSSCLRQFRLNEGLVRTVRDPAALHQTRVALRRLRAAFSLFRPVLQGETFEDLRGELRWAAASLGQARDLDVLLKRLDHADGEGEAIRARLTQARAQAYDEAIAMLESDRLRALMLRLVRWLALGGWRRRGKASRPLGTFAARQLAKRWAKVSERASHLAGLDPESLHRLRIDIKKMRYSAEFFAGLYPTGEDEAPARFVAALETLQDRLGEINDAHVTASVLASAGVDPAAEPSAQPDFDHDATIGQAAAAFDRLRAASGYWH